MKLREFENLACWNSGRLLTKEIYLLTKKSRFSHDLGLTDQVRRASVSIMANIAEGHKSGSDKEFIRFLRYADRSAMEVKSHLYVALDQGYIVQREFKNIEDQIKKVSGQTSNMIKYLLKSRRQDVRRS